MHSTDSEAPLARTFSLALSLEHGRAPRAASLLTTFLLPLETASDLYRQALSWADQSTVNYILRISPQAPRPRARLLRTERRIS